MLHSNENPATETFGGGAEGWHAGEAAGTDSTTGAESQGHALKVDFDQATGFLKTLAPSAKTFTFQTFTDGKNKPSPDPLARVFVGTFDEHKGTLADLNRRGAGVFVTANETDGSGRQKENIVRIRAVFQEADRGGEPELPVEPHIVVESSPGKHHRYVLVDGMPLDQFEPVQQRLVDEYGSDPNAKDRARVLRLPGFYHVKDPEKPHLVRVVHESGQPPIAWAEAKALFPPVVRERRKVMPTGEVPPNMDEIQSALLALDPDMEYSDWLAVLMAVHSVAPGAEGMQLVDEWSSTGSKYTEGCVSGRWGGFDTDGGVTLRTLFAKARDTGWTWRGGEDLNTAVAELAKLPPLEYDRVREDRAKALGVRMSTLDTEVAKARSFEEDVEGQGSEVMLTEPTPWETPVEGAEVLDAVSDAIRRHMVMRGTDADMVALWCAHVYLFNRFSHTPRLLITAPDAECGKTLLLAHMVGNLVTRRMLVELMKTAPFFRLAEKYKPTFLIDEVDVFIQEDSDLLAAINNGWEPHGSVARCVPPDYDVRLFTTHSPVAMAGIKIVEKLPPTTVSRSIVITLERATEEEVAGTVVFDKRKHQTALHELGRKLARWTQDHASAIANADPDLPERVLNRLADKWRPLFAVAEVAGGHWPAKARAALFGSVDEKEPSRALQLLTDIREVMRPNETAIFTTNLIERLVKLEDSPWAEYNYRARDWDRWIKSQQVSRLLKGYRVTPGTVRVGKETAKGYKRESLEPAWKRYLPQEPPAYPSHRHSLATARVSDDLHPSQQKTGVTDTKGSKSSNGAGCDGVTGSGGGSSPIPATHADWSDPQNSWLA